MRGKDLTGQVFTRLTVVQHYGRNAHGHNLWLCNCECGNQKVCNTSDLSTGNTSSCGCLRKETTAKIGKNNATHGVSKLDGYKIWSHMVDRCTNPECDKYENYGGRGIIICDRWLNSPETFISDVGPRPSPEHSIDRIDNDGNYEPGNVRWATQTEQVRNRRVTTRVWYQGRSWALIELSETLNVSYDALRYRVVQKQLSIEEALQDLNVPVMEERMKQAQAHSN